MVLVKTPLPPSVITPSDDTHSTHINTAISEAQDSDAPPTYEEGILTPSTHNADDASSTTPTILETGLISSELPGTVLAGRHPHLDRFGRKDDWRSKEDILTNYQDGTGSWVLEDPGFKEWLEGNVEGNICCLYGPAGVGKTTLAAFITDHLQKTYNAEGTAVISIFIGSKRSRYSQDIESSPLLGSLAHQLLQYPLQTPAYAALKARIQDEDITPGHELETFQMIAAHYEKVFVVIDGLDEWTKTQDGFFKDWMELLATGKFRLLVTSSQPTLYDLDSERTAMIEVCPSKENVGKFVEGRIHGHSELREYVGTDVEGVIEEIAEKSQGSFLLAYLHLQFLISQMKQGGFQEALSSLEKHPDAMVRNLLHVMDSWEESELVRVVLLCITHSPVALTREDIMELINLFAKGGTKMDPPAVGVALDTALSSGLVIVEQERGGYVSLAHSIIEKAIENDWVGGSRFSLAHSFLLTGCCNHISEKWLENLQVPYDVEISRGLTEDDPHLVYAATNWARHAQNLFHFGYQGPAPENVDSTLEKVLDFIKQGELVDFVLHLPLGMDVADRRDEEHQSATPQQPGHREAVTAAYFGLVRPLSELAKLYNFSTEDITSGIQNRAGQTLFSIACGNGHTPLYRWIKCDYMDYFDFNHQCPLKQTPLIRACRGGHITIVRHLLWAHGAGLDPNLTDVDGRSALYHAVDFGHEDIVRHLLDRCDVNPNLRSGTGGHETPLMVAVQGLKVGIVKLLLERRDVDVNLICGASPHLQRTPLMVAVEWGHLDIMRDLLRREDVDVNVRTERGTALQLGRAAVVGGRRDHRVVALEMLESRGDINRA